MVGRYGEIDESRKEKKPKHVHRLRIRGYTRGMSPFSAQTDTGGCIRRTLESSSSSARLPPPTKVQT